MGLKSDIKLIIFKKIWRRNNTNNFTVAVSTFNYKNVFVGKNTYGSINVKHYNHEAKLVIGNYVSIADECVFLLGGEHNYKRISSWPFYSRIYRNGHREIQEHNNYEINIGDDVWIGYGCTILSGVTIGRGSIIGARSIVSQNIEPYSVYVGNKVIKKRFSESVIEKLQGIDWSTIDHQCSDEYAKYVLTEVNENNVDEILAAFCKK